MWKLFKKIFFQILLPNVERVFPLINFFTIPWPKLPLSLLAPKSENSIFAPRVMKNRIHNMGIKRDTPEHMFASLALGSGGNLHVLWTGQLFTSLIMYTIILNFIFWKTIQKNVNFIQSPALLFIVNFHWHSPW